MSIRNKEIRLSGAGNVWLVADGIIRSDSLDHLTKDDAALLTGQYHLKTIIDLRTVTEINERPDKAIPGVEYIHIPLMEETTAGITKEQGTEPAAIAANLPDMPSLYRLMVTEQHSVEALSMILSIALDKNRQPVLYHCTAGKDRTDIVTMLILSYLGCTEEYIIEEYLQSNLTAIPASESIGRYVEQKIGSKAIADKVRHVFVADESYLRSAIEALNERWGNIDEFVKRLLPDTVSHK